MKSPLITLAIFTLIFGIRPDTQAQNDERYYELNPEKCKIIWTAKEEKTKFTGSLDIKSGYIKFIKDKLTEAVVYADAKSIQCTDCVDGETAAKIMEFVRSAKFLNVENMDYAVFKLGQAFPMKGENGNEFQVNGELTIIGYSNKIAMPVSIVEDEKNIRLEAKVGINRALWNLKNPTDGERKTYIDQTIGLQINLEGKLK